MAAVAGVCLSFVSPVLAFTCADNYLRHNVMEEEEKRKPRQQMRQIQRVEQQN